MHVGEIVTRKSYNNDINFVIQDIKDDQAILVGIDFRLIADAKLSDLEEVATRSSFMIEKVKERLKEGMLLNAYTVQDDEDLIGQKEELNSPILSGKCYGKVLHIDANTFYLEQCLRQYMKLGVPVIGTSVPENSQPHVIMELLKKNRPNILVITGHDALVKGCTKCNNIDDYLNSRYYVESIKIARTYSNNYDELVIIAGGCKSYYEELMRAGANFASSPNRILINVTDPVYIACKIAMTSIKEVVDIDAMLDELAINTGKVGGIETRGQGRVVKPKF